MGQDSVRTWPLPFSEQPDLEFKADAIAVAVVPVRNGEAPRMEVLGRDTQDMEVQVRHNGHRVRVDVDWHPVWRWFGGWDVRVVLHVPPALRAKIETDAGSIDVHDLGPCDVELKTSAGRITAENLQGRIALKTDAGQIKGDGLAGTIKAKTSAGAIQLGIADLAPGDHEVHTDVGAIRVEIAAGRDVAVETRTSVGSVQNEYRSASNAQARLRLGTEVGSIKVREAPVRAPTPSVSAVPAAVVADAQPPSSPQSESSTATLPTGPGDLEVERILKMVELGELSAKDADDLLQALGRA